MSEKLTREDFRVLRILDQREVHQLERERFEQVTRLIGLELAVVASRYASRRGNRSYPTEVVRITEKGRAALKEPT